MLKKLCMRGLTIISRGFYVRVTDIIEQVHLQEIDLGSFSSPSDLTVRPFNSETDHQLTIQLGLNLFDDFRLRAQHSFGYILWEDQNVCGYLWATDSMRTNEGAPPFLYDVSPGPVTRYFYDLKVLPHCRLKGAGTTLMVAALKDAAANGKEKVFATRANWNEPMAKLFRKLGFKEEGTIELKRILGLSYKDLRALHA